MKQAGLVASCRDTMPLKRARTSEYHTSGENGTAGAYEPLENVKSCCCCCYCYQCAVFCYDDTSSIAFYGCAYMRHDHWPYSTALRMYQDHVFLVLMMTFDIPDTICHPQLHGKTPPLSHRVGLCSFAESVAQAHRLLSKDLHKYTCTRPRYVCCHGQQLLLFAGCAVQLPSVEFVARWVACRMGPRP